MRLRVSRLISIGRTLARYPLAGPSPAPPFQTVRARFGHTAYRWSLGVRHAQGQDSVSFPTSDRVRAPKTSRTTSGDRKSTRLNSSHSQISYAVFCLKKKNNSTLPGRSPLPEVLARAI